MPYRSAEALFFETFFLILFLVWRAGGLMLIGMALTNYIAHSVICTTIFYGHGLGYFGYLERTEQFAVVVIIWLVQLVVSPLWLEVFRFGPLEWLWRSLVYKRRQPMRRVAAVPTSP